MRRLTRPRGTHVRRAVATLLFLACLPTAAVAQHGGNHAPGGLDGTAGSGGDSVNLEGAVGDVTPPSRGRERFDDEANPTSNIRAGSSKNVTVYEIEHLLRAYQPASPFPPPNGTPAVPESWGDPCFGFSPTSGEARVQRVKDSRTFDVHDAAGHRAFVEHLDRAPRICPNSDREDYDGDDQIAVDDEIAVLAVQPIPLHEPYVAPRNSAVTGRRAFLELREAGTTVPIGTRTLQVPIPALGDSATVTFTPVGYWVLWGDGDVASGSAPTGPWPNGPLHHVYDEVPTRRHSCASAGEACISVRQWWSVTWSYTGSLLCTDTCTGTIGGLRRDASKAIRINEVQAVRRR